MNDPRTPSLEDELTALDKSEENFYLQVNKYPHTFQLENQDKLLTDQLKNAQNALESALSVGFSTAIENSRARNLLAYILFRLRRHTDALKQTQLAETYDGQHENIVSLANRAVMLWRQGNRNQAEELVKKLQEIETENPDFGYLVVKAEAELAFSYTRLDPSFYPFAQEVFTKVIQEARESEVWLWKFGFALTCRRLLRPNVTGGSEDPKVYLSVLQLFVDIVEHCESSCLKARSYAEIALLLFMPSSPDVKETLKKETGLTVDQACEKAIACDCDDNSVLWKCGKLFRYLRKTEKSCDLLKRAVGFRPTSQAYHHLGLTYKAFATLEKFKKSEATEHYNTNRISEDLLKVYQKQLSRSLSIESQSVQDSSKSTEPVCESTRPPGSTDCPDKEGKEPVSQNEDVHQTHAKSTSTDFQVWKIAKSPLKVAITFTEGDTYLPEMIDALRRAVEISEGANTAAVYDLALVYRGMGELQHAKECLEKSVWAGHYLASFNKISFYEQLGLISEEIAEKCKCEKVKKQLQKNSQSMLLMALKTASERCSKSSEVKNNFGNIWHSFATLFEAVDRSKGSSAGKLREKATLFRLIKNYKKSLAVLKDIEQMHPRHANDPEHLKLCIENYVDEQKYEDALTFVDLLQCTSQKEQSMRLFEDEHYLQKIYMQAAKQALLDSSPTYISHFRAVFDEVDAHDRFSTTSEDSDATDDGKETRPTWDIQILHEETKEDTDVAEGILSLLDSYCGLKVTRNEIHSASGFALKGLCAVMKRSKMVMVMAGHKKLSRALQFSINMAARRPSSVTLLVNGDHIPRVMKQHRSMVLPAQLLSDLDVDKFTRERVSAVCEFFSFLVGFEC